MRGAVMGALVVHQVGPGVAVQDQGRTGYLAQGLTRGGAADRLALAEGAALLGQTPDLAALEMAGTGGRFEATADMRIALTGAEMTADIDGAPVAWNSSHLLPAGATLGIGPVRSGVFGYLHVGGGFDTPRILGARAAHPSVGIGAPVAAGDVLPAGPDGGRLTGLTLPRDTRFDGGTVRVVPSVQTGDFTPEVRARFEQTVFSRDPRSDRQGVRMTYDGPGFSNPEQLSVVSEVIVPGDIQIAGDGSPFVLLADCQTTGGYPRIGTVLPCDLPRVVQMPVRAQLRFSFVTLDEGIACEARARAVWAALPKQVRPVLRDPADIRDLLSYRLIDGAVSALDDPLADKTEETENAG